MSFESELVALVEAAVVRQLAPIRALLEPLRMVGEPEPLLKIGELADATHFCVKQLHRYAAEGMPAIGHGRARRFRRSEVEAWLAQKATTGAHFDIGRKALELLERGRRGAAR